MNDCSFGDCVKVLPSADGKGVCVYSSRRPFEVVTFDKDEWEAFLKEVRDGVYG